MPTVLPASAINRLKCMETKRRGSKLSAAYLADWAFALPSYQD